MTIKYHLIQSVSCFSNLRVSSNLIVNGTFLLFIFVLFSQVSFAGATVTGLTGTMLVPDLDILPHGGARAAIHMSGEKEFDEASFKAVFAFSDDFEIAVLKRFSLNGGADNNTDPVFAGKYKIRPNVAIASYIDPNDDYKSSFMVLTGLPGNRVVVGVGANIAMNDEQKKASFGRYDKNSTEVSPLFFVFGASLNIDLDTELTVDYAGNEFVIGLRHAFDETLSLDFGLYTPDRIYDECRYLVGANFGF